ncbi:MAG: acetyl-CoA carboxylase carboxyl transferase subunit alpha [Alphaproteobacteria bacterium]|nr:acetyl-CoA carboxylase carboxyl transferase subunit alpha [Alphaproteobacteria bacterium]HCO99993.1 acetyl-CoA carboxylase carboxyl transferase subunit alpha [Rhodospirillaceae bacterium]
MAYFLEFEKSLAELEGQIEELRRLSDNGDLNIVEEVGKLEQKVDRELRQTYGRLSAWQKVQVARHPLRPKCGDYVEGLITDFTPLAGDRLYAEDNALLSGMGRYHGRPVIVLGQEKGNDTESRVRHNFGMVRPEGYRKSQRLMELANRFGMPILSFVDTSGAYPGVGAEERGQSEAIARAIQVSLGLKVPFVSIIIGEGGSGGAIAIATANTVLMMEHAVYSVISPEGCASILWRDGERAQDAAEALKITAQDLAELKLIDDIVPEPLGGAHREPAAAIAAVDNAMGAALSAMEGLDGSELLARRREKFLKLGNAGLA